MNISTFPNDVQEKLNVIRKLIHENASDFEEEISYGMPAYKTYKKPLVYFAGYAKHIEFYATPTAYNEFEKELKFYKQGKGSVQFPIDKPMPLDLITRIVKFRIEENQNKTK